MIKVLAIAFLTLPICCVSQAATYPFQPLSLSKYAKENNVDDNMTRLRLAVSIDEIQPDKNLKIGDLVFCSSNACYRPQSNNYFAAKATTQGDATIVFDTLVPYGDVKSIYFGDVTGQKVIMGKIELPEPLNLKKGFQGGDIMVLLKKTVKGNSTVYTPTRAVSALIDSEAQSVYYNPNFSSSAGLGLGVTLNIPAGALAQPQIFSVAVRDTGDRYPAVDVYPYLDMQKEFTVSAAPLTIAKREQGTPAPAPSIGGISPKSVSENIAGPKTRAFKRTANLKLSQTNDSSIVRPDAVVQPNDTPCSNLFRGGANQEVIENALSQSGVVYLNWCENIFPYVHIAVVNHRDARMNSTLAYSQKFPEVMNLTQITNSGFQNRAIVSINGFYWEGDAGTGPNQTGRPSGYVESLNNQIGVNYTKGVSQGNKRIFAAGSHSPATTWLDQSGIWKAPLTYGFVVSSSTSVIRDGVCSTDNVSSRFSAFGETDGRIVLVSSTSDGEVTAQTLCGIFRDLGIRNAIRLDGGPSTAITIDKVLKNPITGVARLKYGSLRHIAYALKFGH